MLYSLLLYSLFALATWRDGMATRVPPRHHGMSPEQIPPFVPARPSIVGVTTHTPALRYRKLYTIMTIGSRGDVQPYIALCVGIIQILGRRCRIATHMQFKEWIEGYGIEFRPLAGDPKEIMKLMTKHPNGGLGFFMDSLKSYVGFVRDLLESSIWATEGTDVLIETPPCFAGPHLAYKLTREREQRGLGPVAYFRTMPFPWTKTAHFPHPMAPEPSMLSRYLVPSFTPFQKVKNRKTYDTLKRYMDTAAFFLVNMWRNKHGMDFTLQQWLQVDKVPFLYSFSPSVVPRPTDWPAWNHVCGYWFVPPNPADIYTPPAGLEAFLARDPANTIYVGFGSIPVKDPDEMTKRIIDAAAQARVRVVLTLGWSTPDGDPARLNLPTPRPNHVFILDKVPHEWLFPKVAAVIHHGGAGTVAASLRFGKPTGILPFFGDQRFWARQGEEQGWGIRVAKLSVSALSAAMRELLRNGGLRQRAMQVGARIQREDGVVTALGWLTNDEEYAKNRFQQVYNPRSQANVMRDEERRQDEARMSGVHIGLIAPHP